MSSARRLASRLSTVPESVTSQDDTLTSISEASTKGSSLRPIVHVLADAVVRAVVAFRTAAFVLTTALLVHAPPPLGILVAEP